MPSGVALTIGNFDGVHVGHAALIRRARELAGPGGRVVALAFHPHPMTTLRPGAAPPMLTTWDQRDALLRAAGADEVVRLEPTPQLLSLPPEAFVERVAADHAPSWIVEGEDFRFGHKRAGDVALLERLGRAHGFAVEVVPPVRVATTDQLELTASSSAARWLLEEGRVRDAAIVLGRHYAMRATVQKGRRRGRTIGFPTANLAFETLAPRDGVYACTAALPGGARRPAAVSVGTNPTFGDDARSVEAYILDWDGPEGDEYGWPIEVRFVAWLRDQAAYASVEELVRQIEADVARARAMPDEPPVAWSAEKPEHAAT